MTIQEIQRNLAGDGLMGDGPLVETVRAQITSCLKAETKDNKPYWNVLLSDGTGELSLKVWNDHPAFPFFSPTRARSFIGITGSFSRSKYGIDAAKWGHHLLTEEGIQQVLAGTEARRLELEQKFNSVRMLAGSLADPALRALCERFLEQYGELFRRAAAARGNHHARRGGLLDHTERMMRTADALASGYEVNRSLLLAGALFHDCGKMWENQYESDGFLMPFTQRAELYGHIAIGVEVSRSQWNELKRGWFNCQAHGDTGHEECKCGAATAFVDVLPLMDGAIIDHLCHLILSHHGEIKYGSPVEPKTPEAVLLHFVDNIDAKMEMFAEGYASQAEIGNGVFEKKRPLWVNFVKPLAEPRNAIAEERQSP